MKPEHYIAAALLAFVVVAMLVNTWDVLKWLLP
jgi:hypothetical protein